jgi:hypothetical protein
LSGNSSHPDLTGRNHHSVNMGGIGEFGTSAPGDASVLRKNKASLAMTLKYCYDVLGIELTFIEGRRRSRPPPPAADGMRVRRRPR